MRVSLLICCMGPPGGRIYEHSRAKGGKVTGPAGGRVQLLDAPHTATAT